jgi:hypothetical protein
MITFWVRENNGKWTARAEGQGGATMQITSTGGERVAAENWVRKWYGHKYEARNELRCVTTNHNVYSVWSVQRRGDA